MIKKILNRAHCKNLIIYYNIYNIIIHLIVYNNIYLI